MIKFSTKRICTIAAACGLSFIFGSFVSKNLVNSPITISMVKEAERLSGLALVQDWYEKLKGLDLYLSPSYSDNLLLTNLTGNPCVVLPNGFSQKGLPTSITFMGQLFGEGKTLEAARIYQNATGFHLKHPALNF